MIVKVYPNDHPKAHSFKRIWRVEAANILYVTASTRQKETVRLPPMPTKRLVFSPEPVPAASGIMVQPFQAATA